MIGRPGSRIGSSVSLSQSSRTMTWRPWPSKGSLAAIGSSLDMDVGRLHHLGEEGDLGFAEGSELLDRVGLGQCAQLGEARRHRRDAKGRVHLLVEMLDQ